jgi:hypothetical protein
LLLDELIDVLLPRTDIRLLIMRYVVNLPLINELLGDFPRAGGDDLIDPLAVLDGLAAFSVAEGGEGLVSEAELVRGDADEEMDVWKAELGLAHLEGVTEERRR